MKISYAVTVCNEIEEVANLVELLKKKLEKMVKSLFWLIILGFHRV
jgi:hypothetical protein